MSTSRECSSDHGSSYSEAARGVKDVSEGQESGTQQAMLMYKSYRIPSDMDSQISLPRSYTLPREFKYYRRPKSRKAIRSEHFVASTNSSDGKLPSSFVTFFMFKLTAIFCYAWKYFYTFLSRLTTQV